MTTAASAHEVRAGVDRVITTAWAVAGSVVVIGDDVFRGVVPPWVVTEERSLWCLYLFEHFVELCREPTGWTIKTTEDFVVVAGGKFKIAMDVMSGSCVDVAVVHTVTRVIEGGQG